MNETRQRQFKEFIFISEILQQIRFALRAAERLDSAYENGEHVEMFGAIQSILIAAGNVSKILWPVKKKYKERGESLRHILQIDVKNLLADRKIRNHFEHYDERIDEWFDKTESAVYIDFKIDPLGSPWGPNPPNQHRGYDPLRKVISFRGETFNLGEMLGALKDLQTQCTVRGFGLPE